MTETMTLESINKDMRDCLSTKGVGYTYSRLAQWILGIEAAIRTRDAAVPEKMTATLLGGWCNTLIHAHMYATEREFGNAQLGIKDVLDDLRKWQSMLTAATQPPAQPVSVRQRSQIHAAIQSDIDNLGFATIRQAELDALCATPLPPAQPEGEVVVTRNESGVIVLVSRQDEEGRILSVIAEAQPEFDEDQAADHAREYFTRQFKDHLNPATACLVWNFALALGNKLADAEKKYGYTDGWRSTDWMDECRAKLLEHVAKGDPRDVAAYCAFLWHHGKRTAMPAQPEPANETGNGLQFECRHLFLPNSDGNRAWTAWQKLSPDMQIRQIRMKPEPASATAQPVSGPDGWRKCYSTIIKNLAAIVNAPQTDAQCEAEVIPRDPVMTNVVNIRWALDEFNKELAAPQTPACPHSWHDFGQTPDGVNRVWCDRCQTVAITGYEHVPAQEGR